MRALFFIVFIFSLLSCNQRENGLSQAPDSLNEWFVQNEEALHKDLLKYIKEDSIKHPNDQDWLERQYELFDTTRPVGHFTKMVMEKGDCIGIRYVYSKQETPNAKILITANYQKRCVAIVDSILNAAAKTKLFVIQKYESASDELTLYQFEEGQISSKDIVAEIENQTLPYNITFYVRRNDIRLTEDTKVELAKLLLGEEVLLKRVGSITWKSDTSTKAKILTIGELQLLLTEKDIAQ